MQHQPSFDPTSLFRIAMEPLGATTIFLLVCIVCLLVSSLRKMSETGKLPPGLFFLPFIGNMLQLKNNLPESAEEVLFSAVGSGRSSSTDLLPQHYEILGWARRVLRNISRRKPIFFWIGS